MCELLLSYNPPMRRRWKALVLVLGAVGFFAALLFLLPPRDDGLNWVRKYGGVETSKGHQFVGANLQVNAFTFEELPSGLEDEARAHVTRFHLDNKGEFAGDTNIGVWLFFSTKQKRVLFTREQTWIERQWTQLRRQLGWT
jgi:hypothetical protein